MITISAEDRAKAVLLILSTVKTPHVQLEVIVGAIRGATEQAACIAENYNDEFTTIPKLIASEIRETK